MKDTERQAINNLNNLLQNTPEYDYFTQQIKSNVDILANGINNLDQEVKQKTFEVKNREQLLVQRDNLLVQKESVINQKTAEVQNTKQVLAQKEKKLGEFTKTVFADSLHKLHPDTYSTDPSKWFYKDGRGPLPMKVHYDTNNIQVMEKNINFYKERLTEKEQENIKKEFISSLNELYPDSYSTDPNEWFYKDGKPLPMKVHYDNNNYEVMVKNTLYYKSEIEEISAKKLEEAKRLKEEEEVRKEQVLIDNHREIEDLKALIAQKELEKQELLTQTDIKDQIIVDKDSETESLRNLLLQKEAETQELLAQQKELLVQKEVELANKSLVKNQVIGELQEDIGLKDKEALNLKIESLMKQLAFKDKEVELKDKALEDAHEIVKQNKIINELQEKLLAFKDLSKHDETLQLELSVIHFKVEESILGGNVEEMKELSKYLSELMKNPIEKEESLEISELLNNLSPVHVQENLVQNPLAVINNFDINHINTTHSVYPSGEGSSFSIIQEESFN